MVKAVEGLLSCERQEEIDSSQSGSGSFDGGGISWVAFSNTGGFSEGASGEGWGILGKEKEAQEGLWLRNMGCVQGIENVWQLKETTAWWGVIRGQLLGALVLWNRFLGQPCVTYGIGALGMPVTLPEPIPVCSCFLEVIPSLSCAAIWKSCRGRVLSQGDLRHLLSVKLIMLQSSECLGPLNPECSADFM